MQCRACEGGIVTVVDLGTQPAGGWFPRADETPDALLPLRLGSCLSCGLAQLADASPREAEEPDAPSPMSSATMTAHAHGFVDDLVARGVATPSSRILCLASHGGHLAPFLIERGLPAAILEGLPARAARLTAEGAPVVVGELDGAWPPAGIAPGSLDLIVDSYLLAHLIRPRLALRRIVELLAPDGLLVAEFDHLLAIIEGGQWDAVRHGHQSYISLGWLARELGDLGLEVVDAVCQPVYGGSLRVYARAVAGGQPAVPDLLAREAAAGIDRPAGLAPLGQAVERARLEVVAHLRAARATGRRVVGYGAPARSITFLNALGIGTDLLPFVVDRAPSKQGRTIPGVRIPIRPTEALAEEPPDEVLILTWDLAAEVTRSLATSVLVGTRFYVGIPRMVQIGRAAVG